MKLILAWSLLVCLFTGAVGVAAQTQPTVSGDSAHGLDNNLQLYGCPFDDQLGYQLDQLPPAVIKHGVPWKLPTVEVDNLPDPDVCGCTAEGLVEQPMPQSPHAPAGPRGRKARVYSTPPPAPVPSVECKSQGLLAAGSVVDIGPNQGINIQQQYDLSAATVGTAALVASVLSYVMAAKANRLPKWLGGKKLRKLPASLNPVLQEGQQSKFVTLIDDCAASSIYQCVVVAVAASVGFLCPQWDWLVLVVVILQRVFLLLVAHALAACWRGGKAAARAVQGLVVPQGQVLCLVWLTNCVRSIQAWVVHGSVTVLVTQGSADSAASSEDYYTMHPVNSCSSSSSTSSRRRQQQQEQSRKRRGKGISLTVASASHSPSSSGSGGCGRSSTGSSSSSSMAHTSSFKPLSAAVHSALTPDVSKKAAAVAADSATSDKSASKQKHNSVSGQQSAVGDHAVSPPASPKAAEVALRPRSNGTKDSCGRQQLGETSTKPHSSCSNSSSSSSKNKKTKPSGLYATPAVPPPSPFSTTPLPETSKTMTSPPRDAPTAVKRVHTSSSKASSIGAPSPATTSPFKVPSTTTPAIQRINVARSQSPPAATSPRAAAAAAAPSTPPAAAAARPKKPQLARQSSSGSTTSSGSGGGGGVGSSADFWTAFRSPFRPSTPAARPSAAATSSSNRITNKAAESETALPISDAVAAAAAALQPRAPSVALSPAAAVAAAAAAAAAAATAACKGLPAKRPAVPGPGYVAAAAAAAAASGYHPSAVQDDAAAYTLFGESASPLQKALVAATAAAAAEPASLPFAQHQLAVYDLECPAKVPPSLARHSTGGNSSSSSSDGGLLAELIATRGFTPPLFGCGFETAAATAAGVSAAQLLPPVGYTQLNIPAAAQCIQDPLPRQLSEQQLSFSMGCALLPGDLFVDD